RHLPVVVEEADAREALVRDPDVQLEEPRIALVDALLRQRAVELNHLRLVLRPDGPDRHLGSATQLGGADVLRRVGADRRDGQAVVGDLGPVNDNARVEQDQALRGGEQRVQVDLAADQWTVFAQSGRRELAARNSESSLSSAARMRRASLLLPEA